MKNNNSREVTEIIESELLTANRPTFMEHIKTLGLKEWTITAENTITVL